MHYCGDEGLILDIAKSYCTLLFHARLNICIDGVHMAFICSCVDVLLHFIKPLFILEITYCSKKSFFKVHEELCVSSFG